MMRQASTDVQVLNFFPVIHRRTLRSAENASVVVAGEVGCER